MKKINERMSSGVAVHGVGEMKKIINERMSWGWIFENEGQRWKNYNKNACGGHVTRWPSKITHLTNGRGENL
jgi:hypothetical protein